eukprot:SAG22_NODE_31_length_27697_cov_7.384376_9_plen_164_part_00
MLVKNDAAGKVVLPQQDLPLKLHFALCLIAVMMHAKGLAGLLFAAPAALVVGMFVVFRRLESGILDAQYANFEQYQIVAGKRWLVCSLCVLALWIWIAVDQPSDGLVMLLKAVITAFPCVSLPLLAVPLLSQRTVAIRFAGTWRRPYLVAMGEEVLLFTLFWE